MAAPEYVPQPKIDHTRVYHSPPWTPEPWMADRPAEIRGGQPVGPRLGTPGPDQGYAFRLARRFETQLQLDDGERAEDAVAGCVMVALKRASLYSRAPMVHDLQVAFTLWGFLGDAPEELRKLRRAEFDGVAHPHHYMKLRRIPDLVPRSTLRQTPDEVAAMLRTDWKTLFRRSAAPAPA
ncbi:MAG: hypothetical protein JJU45_19475 [Acidimicrobiia bacterium]|nr:hypothetical protein [Acidimicrobiia bacterium]